MAKQWFVIHTYSGYENKVKEMLEERVQAYKFQDVFGEILVPAEDVEEIIKGLKGKKRLKQVRVNFSQGTFWCRWT